MIEDNDTHRLQQALAALQAACPELEPSAVIVLLATREYRATGRDKGINTALLAQQLGFEHAMVYRAATELETRGYISSTPVGGASPALRLLPL